MLIALDNIILLPIILALHSFIYPFNYGILTPYLRNDHAEDDEENSMTPILMGIPFLFGIIEADREDAFRIIRNSSQPRLPLVIDLTKPDGDKD